MFPKSFATVAAMIAYIDVNNGGAWGGGYVGGGVSWNHATIDTTWQSAPYTAPNKKVYYLFKTVDGRYSSYTFSSAKYFDSLENVRTYIYNNNR